MTNDERRRLINDMFYWGFLAGFATGIAGIKLLEYFLIK